MLKQKKPECEGELELAIGVKKHGPPKRLFDRATMISIHVIAGNLWFTFLVIDQLLQ